MLYSSFVEITRDVIITQDTSLSDGKYRHTRDTSLRAQVQGQWISF